MKIINSYCFNTDAEKFSEEMKEKFNERRAQLSKDLGDLNKKLLLKQSRAEDMKMSSEMYDQIKEEYEVSIFLCQIKGEYEVSIFLFQIKG